MKSLDDLTEMHRSLWLACYNYAAGRLNGEPLRDALRGIIIDTVKSRLSTDDYDFEVICDATNNPPSLLAAGGYRIDIRITEKLGLMRTFVIPIGHPENFMSLT